jgi:antitoxin (DNA-binding transcriptional repressor) of toxin-antitoxin stability system
MSTIQINMHEAKTRLSQLGEQVWEGKKVVIAKAGKPYLDLCPHTERPQRKPGRLKGKIKLSRDFLQTPQSIIDEFGGA